MHFGVFLGIVFVVGVALVLRVICEISMFFGVLTYGALGFW